MTNVTILKEAVDALGYAFHEFKATNDERLGKLEQKGTVDPLVTEKLERMNHALDQMQQRVMTLKTSAQRPMMAGVNADDQDTGHTNAFLEYVRKGNAQALESFEKKSLSTDPEAEGGFLVPHVVSDYIHTILRNNSFLRPLARVTSISTSTLEMLLDKTEAAVGWVAEKGERNETNTPEVGKINIPVHELYANPRATQKLLDDSSINVETWLAEKIGRNMAMFENAAFLAGDGEGKPKGFLAYDLAEKAEWQWGRLECIKTGVNGAFKEEMPEQDLINLFHSLKPAYLSKAVWLMSRSAQNEVRKMRDLTSGHYLWQPSLALETTPTLMGYPVHVMDDMPSLVAETASKSIAFGNFFEGYQIVDRKGTHILRDPYSHKPYIEFYATRRVGGDVINFEALKILHFSE